MGPRERRRDYGIELIGRISRWMIAGSLMLAGMLAYVADHAFRGHTLSASGTPVSSASAQSQAPASSDGGGAGLQQPAQAPTAPVSAPAPVVSGGS